jgi:putative ABC transport system substrate-binding protein
VTNLARPGGNVTGFTTFEPAMGSKWLEVLKEVAPSVTRIALLFNPDTAPYVEIFLNSVDAASRSFAVTAIKASVRDAGEIERSIARFSAEPSGGMIVMPGRFHLVPSRVDHPIGGPAPFADHLPISLLRGRGRLAYIRN